MQTIHVRPAKSARVRIPERGHALMSEEGAEVPRNAFWIRRLRAGDVVETSAPKAKPAAKAKGE